MPNAIFGYILIVRLLQIRGFDIEVKIKEAAIIGKCVSFPCKVPTISGNEQITQTIEPILVLDTADKLIFLIW